MITTLRQSRYFLIMLTLCCLGYLAIAWLYQHHTMIAVDEFWFAHRIYQYHSGLPYRDFAPYKTVIGYYLILPAFYLANSNIIDTLLSIKTYIACLNALVLFASAVWLSRFFSRKAVLISLGLLITSEIFISYASQIRVDLIGYWFCLFSLLCLLDKRFFFAGLLLGLGFATTQKVIWYFAASNVTLTLYWLIYTRNRRSLLSLITFNVTFFASIIVYIATWSMVSDFHTVMNSLFSEASAMYQLDWYDSTRLSFWRTIVIYNPLLYLLWPFTIVSLLTKADDNTSSRFFITVFSLIILLCLIPYKQVFPYYMQVTFPVLFILYAAFISWLIEIFQHATTAALSVTARELWLLSFLYFVGLLSVINLLNLPIGYLFLFCIPLAINIRLTNVQSRRLPLVIISMAILIMQVIFPVIQLPHKLSYLEGSYQRDTLDNLSHLIKDGGDYIAGIELIYDKDQPINGIRHLMGPAVDYLYHPTEKLARVMLPSLYEDPRATIDSVINDLDKSNVKVFINNYRMNALPPKIRHYLDNQFAQWRGSIYLYAPRIQPSQQLIHIKFAGNYEIDSRSSITLNGAIKSPGSHISLLPGDYPSQANAPYRLKWLPNQNSMTTNPAFQTDEWRKVIY